MEPIKQAIGVVIRATGEVPMDPDINPDVEAHMISSLAEAGHDVRWNEDEGYRIAQWPPTT